MAKNNELSANTISWSVPEYIKHARSKNWYIFASLVAFLMLVYSFWTGNFLFAIIIVVGAIVVILHDSQDPNMVNVVISSDGILIGRKLYDYDEFKNFSIVYKPMYGIKNLYLEFNNAVKPRLSVSLDHIDPLPIRDRLLKFLPENYDRTGEPLSESISNFFKL